MCRCHSSVRVYSFKKYPPRTLSHFRGFPSFSLPLKVIHQCPFSCYVINPIQYYVYEKVCSINLDLMSFWPQPVFWSGFQRHQRNFNIRGFKYTTYTITCTTRVVLSLSCSGPITSSCSGMWQPSYPKTISKPKPPV